MKHLILVGACYLDTILSVSHYPEEDAKLRADRLQVRRGGNCPNTLEVLLQLLRPKAEAEASRGDNAADDNGGGGGGGGGKEEQRQQAHEQKLQQKHDALQPYLVSPLPALSSPATSNILSSFGPHERAKANFDHCLYREGHSQPASSYIIRSQANGSRTIVNYNDLPEMTLGEFVGVADAFRGNGSGSGSGSGSEEKEKETWWHFEGRIPETTLACIRYLRGALPSCSISVEVEKPNRDGLRELAAEADVVFYSKSWAESRGYREAEACLRGEVPPQAGLIFCTWGAQGASALSLLPVPRSYSCLVQEPLPASQVVDTIGAGDTFIAAVLYCLLCHGGESDLQATLSFAVGLATRKVQTDGFRGLGDTKLPPIPGAEQ